MNYRHFWIILGFFLGASIGSILSVPPALGHSTVQDSQTFIMSDNYFRYNWNNATIFANQDLVPYGGGEGTSCNLTRIRDSGLGDFLQGSSTPINTETICQYQLTTSTSPLGTAFGPGSFQICCDNREAADNKTRFNFTFPQIQGITDYSMVFTMSPNNPAGTQWASIQIYDADFNVLHYNNFTKTCSTTSYPSSTHSASGLARLGAKGIRIVIDNTTACGATNWGISQANVWSSDQQDSIFTHPALEYLDYYAQHAVTPVTYVATGGKSVLFNNLTIPGMTSWWIITSGFAWDSSDGLVLTQAPNMSQSATNGLSLSYMGGAHTNVDGRRLSLWNLTNPTQFQRTLGVIGFVQTSMAFANLTATENAFYKSNSPGQGLSGTGLDGNFGTGTPMISNVTCGSCNGLFRNLTVVAAYPQYSSPFVRTLLNEVNIGTYDFLNASIATIDTNASRTFYVNLTNQNWWGNAIVFNLADTGPEPFCDASTKISVSTEINLIQFSPIQTMTTADKHACFWLIEDFGRTLGLRNYWHNHPSDFTKYTIRIESGLNTTGLSPDFYALTGLISNGKGSLRMWCGYAGVPACFGNWDTSMFDIAGDSIPATWYWNFKDSETVQPVNEVSVIETTTETGGLSDSLGYVNLTTTSTTLNWSASKSGYNSYYMNVSNLIFNEIFINVSFSRSPTFVAYRTSCVAINNTAMNCTVTPSQNATDICNEFFGNDFTCRNRFAPGGAQSKEIDYVCPIDGTDSNITGPWISAVNVTDSIRNHGIVTATVANAECAVVIENIVDVYGGLFNWTWSKAGYRPITAFFNNLSQYDVIQLFAIMKTGDGPATNLKLTFIPGTVTGSDGIPRSLISITLEDLGASTTPSGPPGTVPPGFGVPPGGGTSVDQLIGPGLAANLGFVTEGGRNLWGFILVIVFTMIIVGAYVFVTKSVNGAGYLGIGGFGLSFLVVTFMGLFSANVIIGFFLIVAAIIAIVIKAKTSSEGGM